MKKTKFGVIFALLLAIHACSSNPEAPGHDYVAVDSSKKVYKLSSSESKPNGVHVSPSKLALLLSRQGLLEDFITQQEGKSLDKPLLYFASGDLSTSLINALSAANVDENVFIEASLDDHEVTEDYLVSGGSLIEALIVGLEGFDLYIEVDESLGVHLVNSSP